MCFKINTLRRLIYSICEDILKDKEGKVCLGTTCFVMGSSNLQELIETVPAKYGDKVEVSGVPCLGLCSIDWEFSKAPYVKVNDDVIKEATVEKVLKAIDEKLKA